MIYFLIIIILLVPIVIYDLWGANSGRAFMSRFVLFAIIALAGFRFRVGSDTIVYMKEYENILSLDRVGIKYLFQFPGRQPGWILLLSFLKMFSSSFYLVQILHAIFINTVIVSFLRRSTQFYFSAVLIYFVVLYPNLNFEVLRESIAISIFLLSISFYERKMWKPYYALGILALFFHESSVIVFLLPLVRNVKVNKTIVVTFLISIPVVFLLASTLKEQIAALSIFSEDIANKTTYYFNLENSDVGFSVSMISNIFISVILPLWMLYVSLQRKSNTYYDGIVLVALFLYLISLAIPIFYRFNNYLLLFTLLTFVRLFDFISIRPANGRVRNLVYITCVLSFLVVKSRIYFTENENGSPNYVKYFPYYSIFDEEYDQRRESYYRAY